MRHGWQTLASELFLRSKLELVEFIIKFFPRRRLRAPFVMFPSSELFLSHIVELGDWDERWILFKLKRWEVWINFTRVWELLVRRQKTIKWFQRIYWLFGSSFRAHVGDSTAHKDFNNLKWWYEKKVEKNTIGNSFLNQFHVIRCGSRKSWK